MNRDFFSVAFQTLPKPGTFFLFVFPFLLCDFVYFCS